MSESPDAYVKEYTIDVIPGNHAHRMKKMASAKLATNPTDEGKEEDGDDDDTSPLAILLQFIPYYGQGTPATDSIVRSALSNMSVEEIDSKDEHDNTLLLLACQFRAEDLARIMLNKGADPSALNSQGACCLHFVCYKDTFSFSVAKALIQNGANPEVQEQSTGCTPLHYAAQTGDINMCKLLLSHGAQINTVDFSKYTCVDYAKWDDKQECATYLQEKLTKFNTSPVYGVGNGVYGGMYGGQAMGSPMPGVPAFNVADWIEYEDPATQCRYFTNFRTNECLWEQDYRSKAATAPRPAPPPLPPGGLALKSPSGQAGFMSPTSAPAANTSSDDPSSTQKTGGVGSLSSMGGIHHSFYKQHPALKAEADLEYESFKLRIMAFFNKHAKAREQETLGLLEKYKGKEFDLIRDLCKQYGVALDPEVAAYHVTLKELQTEHLNKNVGSSSMQRLGSSMMSPKGADGPSSLSTQFTLLSPSPKNAMMNTPTMGGGGGGGVPQVEVEAMAMKLKEYENQLAETRKALAEKDGSLIGLKSELDTLRREKNTAMDAKSQLEEKISRTSTQGGEAIAKYEQEISMLQDANGSLKTELTTVKQDLTYAKERLQSAENTLSNTTSGHQEQIAREQKAAEERAAQMRETEVKHAQAIRDLEGMLKANDVRSKHDLSQSKLAAEKQESDLRTMHEKALKECEDTIQTLERELTALKAKSTQEISAAQMEIEVLKSTNDQHLQQAEFVKVRLQQLEIEVAEARALEQYNQQLHKDLAREQIARKRLHNEIEDMKGKIRVYVRIRPLSKTEKAKNCAEALVKDGKLSVQIRGHNGADSKKTYDFDSVFAGAEQNTQADVFKDTKHLMLSVIDGYNVCIFAYGQTGAGKSFTMIGAGDLGTCIRENGEFDELAGITPRAVSELFRLLSERQAQVSTEVEVQMFQLYRDGLDDLLVGSGGKKKRNDFEGGDRVDLKITLAEHSATGLVNVEGACSMVAENAGDVMRIFAKGAERRTTASTQMNAESSRSHLICCLVVKLTNRRTGNETIGKLTLVDLAGSERVDKSGAAGEVLKEAQSINKSLSALGDVIAALTSGQQHVPYRNHPLTMLMSDSLGGNAKTLMFVNCSPADYNVLESNSSLSFASRCKDITNNVAQGPGVQAAQMMALKKELAKLKSAQGFKPYNDMPSKKAPGEGGVGKGKPPPT